MKIVPCCWNNLVDMSCGCRESTRKRQTKYEIKTEEKMTTDREIMQKMAAALKKAEYAIKGREHTGFIAEALAAYNEHIGRKG